MLFNKLFLLTLAATSMVANILCKRDVVVANATNGSESQSIDVNYCTSYGAWTHSEHHHPVLLDINNCNQINLFRNCEFHGEELIGETYYSSLSENITNNTDTLCWFSHNINLYSKNEDLSYEIAIPFDNNLFTRLSAISIDLEKPFYIPAIKIDDDLVARFYVNGSSVKLITFGNDYLSVSESYTTFSPSGYETHNQLTLKTIIYFHLNIQTSYKKNISHISTLDLGGFRDSEDGYGSIRTYSDNYYLFDYKEGYIPHNSLYNFPFIYDANCMVSPYDITYLDLSGGDADFSLGNSIYGELYGTARQVLRLVGITFAVNYKGISPELDGQGFLQLFNMDKSDYNNWVNNENFEVPINEFAYLSRGRHDDEIGGEGSLINAFYIPNPDLSHIDDSIISVHSMTFINAGQTSWVSSYDPRETLTDQGVSYSTETYYLPWDISSYEKAKGISYKYHSDPAVGKCSQRTVGINLSNEFVTTYVSSPLTYGLANLAAPILGVVVVYICNYFASGNMSAGKNIQRIMFNLYDSKNRLIRNITQLQFAYQKGNREPQVIETEDGIYNLKKFKDLKLEFITRGKSDSLVSQSSNIWRTISTQENGFMELPEGQSISVGEVDYNCFYQNIYNTKTRADFMCYWSALSVWHVIESGETERLTTNVDGYYLVYDEDDMNWHVVSIDNPDEDVGISVDDYLNGDTYGHSDGIEPPEDNDFDKKMNNLFSRLEDLGKWFLILNAVVLGIGLIGGIAYLIIRFGGFLGLGGSRTSTTINLNDVEMSNGSKRKKKSKVRKEKRKRKKGK